VAIQIPLGCIVTKQSELGVKGGEPGKEKLHYRGRTPWLSVFHAGMMDGVQWRRIRLNRRSSTVLSPDFAKALELDLPILFAYIGWAHDYDGSEAVRGTHAYLRANPDDKHTSEAQAFRRKRGYFSSGVGRGYGPERLHVVLIALDPVSNAKRVVGVYAAAMLEHDSDWSFARTRTAVLIPVDRRPNLTADWPAGQGIRRWAQRTEGAVHPPLLKYFRLLKRRLPAIMADRLRPNPDADQTYAGLGMREGQLKRRLVIHREREARLRKAKIDKVLELCKGRLICEVPGCGFDFFKKYGDLGFGYAHVHHLVPLAQTNSRRRRTTLDDLAIVCANCHAMIHRGGDCRDLADLLSG
jgi:hypothetical protein